MARPKHFFVSWFFVLQCCFGCLADDNPYRHFVTLDPKGKYQLEWLVDFESRHVTFNVTVQTTGYVGFGLSRKGKMVGADLIIGGVLANGVPYFSDRHAIANQLPVEDTSQDWKLHEAWERSEKTFLSFSRAFDTCDEDHDLPITNDLTSVIWAYSEVDDDLQYHFQNRGTYDVYLLDPDLVPRNIEDVTRKGKLTGNNVSLFNITRQFLVQSQDTTYWCSFHKIPTTTKRHIIGLNTAFPTDRDRQHVHHLLLHRCRAPPGVDPAEFFEGPTRSGGSECYVLDGPNTLPVPYCREVIHIWGYGGRAAFFPEHVGIPISESADDQYLMLQVHYDNPNNVSNLPVTVSLEMYHTGNLREHDLGVWQLGDNPGSTTLILPPSEPNHVIMAHCAPGCTERILGASGEANVVGVLLHTHRTGRGVRLLQFRNGQELPRIQWDDNFNYAFQQLRILREEAKVLPGDLLVSRCNYDNTDQNGTAIVGGVSTRGEMCSIFVYYYNRAAGFSLCRGDVQSESYFDLLGVRNLTWVQSLRTAVVSPPHRHAGVTLEDYANNNINWNLQTRKRLQNMQIYEPQLTQCPRFFYEDRQKQLEQQVRNTFPQTGRLPGSDGRPYFSVDGSTDHVSELPRGQERWRPEPQCSKQKPGNLLY